MNKIIAGVIGLILFGILNVQSEDYVSMREKAQKLQNDGNSREAFDIFKKLALGEEKDPKHVGDDMLNALNCMRKLNMVNQTDEFRESAISANSNNWRLLETAANSYILGEQHYGAIVAGKFERGSHRGGGKYANSNERDRVRSFQLFDQAVSLIEKSSDADAKEKFSFYRDFAGAVFGGRGYSDSWKLQYLTDLSQLPDYEEGYFRGYGRGEQRGAPVDENGNPVYYKIPANFADAVNDGQRWRWLLEAAKKAMPANESEMDLRFADFLHGQFGVQTMAYYGRMPILEDSEDKEKSGPYAVHTLSENETIAKLATGIKRFELPDEFNFIKIYQKVAIVSNTHPGENALQRLADIFKNRRQYPRAAEYLRESIKRFGPGHDDYKKKELEQITGKWGTFEPGKPVAAEKQADVMLRFRNANEISFEAYRLDVNLLLKDLKDYLKSNPKELEWEKINLGNIGYRIVNKDEKKYITGKPLEWKQELKPLKNHFDSCVTIKTPIKDPGAYLLVGKITGGNVSRIIIWLADTVIIQKPLQKKNLYYVADAETGAPLSNAAVDIFGYQQKYLGDDGKKIKKNGRRYDVKTKEYKKKSGDDGIIYFDSTEGDKNYNWLVSTISDEGRLAFIGFENLWFGDNTYDAQYNETKAYFITDRPVYRPGDSVKFKFWVRHAKYDIDDSVQFAGKNFLVAISGPKEDEIFTQNLKSDAFGGAETEYKIPKDGTLGVYNLYLKDFNGSGGLSFRVEEYKKPEFEVSVKAPSEPVKLGDKITAEVNARYYFGAPVQKAKVKYKVQRYEHNTQWYPPFYWDWFYGPGYWWFSYDYEWYPGWRQWGCCRPSPFWFPSRSKPPELVMENEVQIGGDGIVKIEIDTAPALAFHGDTDHRYEITVEVTDESRRTIVGRGSVIAAIKPFSVNVWVDNGYYRTGDTVSANFAARTPDGKPVKGKGAVKLVKINYNEKGEPSEKTVQTWPVETNDEGNAELKMKAAESGQFRISCSISDSKNNSIEGAYIFTVIGDKKNDADFRFNDIELVNNKTEYKPGEKAALMINTNRVNSTVLLFVRPSNGIYLAPEIIKMDGKSIIKNIEISMKDMPNIFVEAVTISGGQVFNAVKELVVPPESRVLNLEIIPSKEKYKPGENAKVKLKVSDYNGKPVTGTAVAAVYDKSVEYISGGPNTQEIKAFFWKWRRSHNPFDRNSLQMSLCNLLRDKETPMTTLGVFGELDTVTTGSVVRGDRIRKLSKFKGGAESDEKTMMVDSEAEPAVPMEMADKMALKEEGAAAPGGEDAQVTVRKDFADTALWLAKITPDQNGEAEIELKMPENLTTWKVKFWSLANGTRVGQGETEVITSKDLIVRLQAPRFFIDRDEVVLSANVHNYLKSAKSAKVALELAGNCLEIISGNASQKVDIDAGGEKRVDWRVKVVREGQATVRMKAITDEESDAMEMKFPVYPHGIEKMVSFSGNIRPEGSSASFEIEVPEQRKSEETRFELRYSPTLAGAMVDALPYLCDYPYGCTEQTLDRFLPAVITQNILKNMGLNLRDIRDKITNLNAQEIGDDVERAKQWKRYPHVNPVFDEEKVSDMVNEGVKALAFMQVSDGGWGWFSGFGEYSSPHTTALVAHGLQIAKMNGVSFDEAMLDRGVSWLKNYQDGEIRKLKNAPNKINPWKEKADNIDAFVFMVLTDASVNNDEMKEFLYRDRTGLSVYAMAMFGMALQKIGDREKLAMIMRNIGQFLVEDNENQTAYLNLGNGGYWWFWYGSEYEAHAYYLKLLSATEPKSEKASRLVKYLLNNRKHAAYWNSTRDTALCIEALAEYLRASGENKPEMEVSILFDGKEMKKVRINKDNLFSFDNKFVLEANEIQSGKHKIEIVRTGGGPVYYNAYLSYFSLEDYIKKAGLEIKVDRKYYRLKEVDKKIKVSGSRGQALDQKVEKYEREEIPDLATLKSGELVEVELFIQSKNEYEYLIFEDMKPAGFEPCEVRSGYNGNEMGAYVEFRDEKVCFFVHSLARGSHSVSYRMRAEIPGRFSALPTKGYAMYAPELKANSDEIKLNVK